jgi:Mce-associated membrane protein
MTVTTNKKTEPEENVVGNDEDGGAAEGLDLDKEDPETEGAVDDESVDAEGDSDAGESMQRRWPRRVLVGAVALIFVASLVASGILGWNVWQQQQVTRAGEQAQQAAVKYAEILTSIDSNKVDENFNQVLDGATGEFKDMYSQSSMQLRQLLIDNKATAHGVVVESAIQSASKSKVVVLLFVDQSVSNTSVPDPRIDRSRIKMTMEHVDGLWRTSKVELR